jgi:hypothetical protein
VAAHDPHLEPGESCVWPLPSLGFEMTASQSQAIRAVGRREGNSLPSTPSSLPSVHPIGQQSIHVLESTRFAVASVTLKPRPPPEDAYHPAGDFQGHHVTAFSATAGELKQHPYVA